MNRWEIPLQIFISLTNLQFMSQVPINSPFTASSTTADVVRGLDLTGKVAIVTGGYVGLGLESTKALLSAGATVIVPVRTPDKAAKNLAGLNVETYPLDLLDPSSIDAFAAHFIASNRALHILINNAGIMASPLLRDSRGYEGQFATNHLGHFQLTARLWPALVKAGGARVVNVSSRGHHFSELHDDWNFESRPYDPWKSYGQSKTANILFALALDRRGSKHGVQAFSIHPGVILTTELTRWTPQEELRKTLIESGFADAEGRLLQDPLRQAKTPEQGAATEIWAAVSPLLEGHGGVYCENCNISPRLEGLVIVDPKIGVDRHGFFGVKDYATNLEIADKLWRLSEQLTGVTFTI
jgi:NAD(P)-dependent dehydrogenase (short-subunit alcohol dehydrogenase family)